MSARTWFITGASSGLGHALALKTLKQGDKVIATSRNHEKLEDLRNYGAFTITLDLHESQEYMNKLASDIIRDHGQIDVVVNNVGALLIGALEEVSDQELKDDFDTNVFAPVRLVRAFLPHMKERSSGTIVFLGSMMSWATSSMNGTYTGSKHAIRAVAQTFMSELEPLGIRTILVEPAVTRTDAHSPHTRIRAKHPISTYDDERASYHSTVDALVGRQIGDPEKIAQVLIDAVQGKNTNNWLPTGSDFYSYITKNLKNILDKLESMKDIMQSTDYSK